EAEQDQDEGHDQQDQRHGEGGIVGALGEGQQVAESAAGGDELADHGAGEGGADRDLEIAHDPGRHRGDVDFPEQGGAAAAERPDAFDQADIDLADAGIDGEEDEHGDQDDADRDLGAEPDPEPDD